MEPLLFSGPRDCAGAVTIDTSREISGPNHLIENVAPPAGLPIPKKDRNTSDMLESNYARDGGNIAVRSMKAERHSDALRFVNSMGEFRDFKAISDCSGVEMRFVPRSGRAVVAPLTRGADLI